MDELDQANGGHKQTGNGNGSFKIEERGGGQHLAVYINRMMKKKKKIRNSFVMLMKR